jgi:hypothetical protein
MRADVPQSYAVVINDTVSRKLANETLFINAKGLESQLVLSESEYRS